MAKQSTSKYTAAMVARIQEVAAEKGKLNLEIVTQISAEPAFEKAGVTARGIVMKAISLGLDYEKVERVTKAGEPVMQKADMAEAIGKRFGVNVPSLAKAEKQELRALLAAVTQPETVN